MLVKEVFDELFEKIEFDEALVKKLTRYNIKFTTSNPEMRDMFGGKLLGCFHLSYTQYHKNHFYDEMFGLSYNDVLKAVKKITSLPSKFKISGDDMNLTCFYLVHRFLNSKKLDNKHRHIGAQEALNYFGYRTMVTLSADWFEFPIKKERAVTLYENLSGNFLIVKLKNWNAYIHYRSKAYLENTYAPIVKALNDDDKLPNAINDYYNRYKDMFKYIYAVFMKLEKEKTIKESKNVVSDTQGREVLLDRIESPIQYADRVKDSMMDAGTFIRSSLIEISCTVITSVSQKELEETLKFTMKYTEGNPKKTKEVFDFIEDFLADAISYLQANKSTFSSKANVITVIDKIVGNLLYSRGADISITEVKRKGEVLVSSIYKHNKSEISKRNITSVRNIFCVYILLLALIH